MKRENQARLGAAVTVAVGIVAAAAAAEALEGAGWSLLLAPALLAATLLAAMALLRWGAGAPRSVLAAGLMVAAAELAAGALIIQADPAMVPEAMATLTGGAAGFFVVMLGAGPVGCRR